MKLKIIERRHFVSNFFLFSEVSYFVHRNIITSTSWIQKTQFCPNVIRPFCIHMPILCYPTNLFESSTRLSHTFGVFELGYQVDLMRFSGRTVYRACHVYFEIRWYIKIKNVSYNYIYALFKIGIAKSAEKRLQSNLLLIDRLCNFVCCAFFYSI